MWKLLVLCLCSSPEPWVTAGWVQGTLSISFAASYFVKWERRARPFPVLTCSSATGSSYDYVHCEGLMETLVSLLPNVYFLTLAPYTPGMGLHSFPHFSVEVQGAFADLIWFISLDLNVDFKAKIRTRQTEKSCLIFTCVLACRSHCSWDMVWASSICTKRSGWREQLGTPQLI